MTIWIGKEYAILWSVIWILLLPIISQMQAACIHPINTVYKKVKIPAIANFIAGIINTSLALSLPFVFNIGIYGVAIAYAVSMIFLTFFVSPFYNAYVIGAPKFTYFKYMVLCQGVIVLLVFVGKVYSAFVVVDSIIMLILSCLVISVPYGLIILKLVLQKEERDMIRGCIPSVIGKLIPKWLL